MDERDELKKREEREIASLSKVFSYEKEKRSKPMASLGYCTGACPDLTEIPILKVVLKHHRRDRPFSCPDCSYALIWKIIPLKEIPEILNKKH